MDPHGAATQVGGSHNGGSGDQRHRLSVVGGLAALSLDAMASVAYGSEAIVLALAVAGGVGLGFTVPVTVAIAVLLGVLTFSYRQAIAASAGRCSVLGGHLCLLRLRIPPRQAPRFPAR